MFILKIFKKMDFWLSFIFALSAIGISFIVVPYVFPDVLQSMFATCLLFGFFAGEFLCEVKHLIKEVIQEEKERIRAIEEV
ncbi:hypothetical protein [Parageobacillus thermoglucosidasius]|uniref:hypothetical protein n=1 Tax=Parageobacillus thermoglucosidasius TaxID=1426 RepID=UPI0001D17A5E|nr:hypothetical protein [Parageobacillus thermoglucosidasius]AEH47133.1 hypothetical protein Geoth_1138 [Parageobacillus thermoglucosidasius C56-YS93]